MGPRVSGWRFSRYDDKGALVSRHFLSLSCPWMIARNQRFYDSVDGERYAGWRLGPIAFGQSTRFYWDRFFPRQEVQP